HQLDHRQSALVRHAVPAGGEAPVVAKLIALENSEREVRVPEVDRQQHVVSLPAGIAGFGFYNERMLSAKRNLAAEEVRQLRPFWREGRIIRWPAREGRRRLVLAEVVRTFPLGRRLAEAEGDPMLRSMLPGSCRRLLRRVAAA